MSSRYLALAEIGVALAILAATIAFATYKLREQSRQQITGQHARVLHALWMSQKWSEQGDVQADHHEQTSDQLTSFLRTMQLPQMAGLLGTRLFDADGQCFYVPDPLLPEGTLDRRDFAELRRLIPVARFHSLADISYAFFAGNEPARGPVLEVNIPLHAPGRENLFGIAQFLIDGTEVAAELERLDRNLIHQATLTFLVGGGMLALFLGFRFYQLQRMNRLLAERTQSLLKANQELALAAKTSAVGAVTAHLIHGLKNPLSGLQTFMAARGTSVEDGDDDWQFAISSTRRMQTMINEVVRVLQDEQVESQYQLTLQEFAQIIEAKVRPLARDAGVEFECDLPEDGVLGNREANLLNLVIYNLVQNAIQATPPGKSVALTFRPCADKVVCEVRDQGPGISSAQQANLFKPCRSTKDGGSGIGLAISKQLAASIGAELELKETGPQGSVFQLVFEPRRPLGDDDLAASEKSE